MYHSHDKNLWKVSRWDFFINKSQWERWDEIYCWLEDYKQLFSQSWIEGMKYELDARDLVLHDIIFYKSHMTSIYRIRQDNHWWMWATYSHVKTNAVSKCQIFKTNQKHDLIHSEIKYVLESNITGTLLLMVYNVWCCQVLYSQTCVIM